MKKTSYIYTATMATLMACTGMGCQDEMSTCYGLTQENVAGESNGSRTQLVEKVLTGIVAESLPTLLTDEEKATVQKLELQGELCGKDILFIKTELPQLVELDMTGVNIRYMHSDSDYYSVDANGTPNMKLDEDDVIPASMFSEQRGLKKIGLPNTVEEIGYNAFYSCPDLEEVILPYRLVNIGQQAFYGCQKLKSIEFTPNIRKIERYAFSDTGLKSVVIPKNVQQIHGYAFSDNDSIESVVINSGKVSISESVFGRCYNLNNVQMNDEIETIPDYMFTECHKLENITLPGKLKSIGNRAFSYSGLRKVVIPQEVTKIYSSAFNMCDSLKEVVFMPDSIQMENMVFSYCRTLETINLPNMAEIPEYIFEGCTMLKNVDIPQTVKTIGRYAFNDTGLEEINISQSVNRLEEYCFRNTKLKTLTVPGSVTYVGDNIVEQCQELDYIYWNSECDVNIRDLNPNIFLFLNSNNGKTVGWTRSIKNVVIDGVAEQIVCSSDGSDYGFRCPQSIQVKNIKFEKYFTGTTYIGQNSNWYTISLPFKPTKIVTEDGRTLAPFGSSMETEDTKPFWLRTLTEEGFVDAQEIEKYKPYIICMPNNPYDYLPEYNIEGYVIFSGKNITLEATPETHQPTTGPGYKFYPTMEHITASNDIYAMEQWGSSSFYNNNEVRAFEAYIVMDSQNSGAAQSVDVSRANKASRAAMIYEKKTGVPHISDIK